MPAPQNKLESYHKLLDVVLTAVTFISAYYVKQNLSPPIGGLATTPNYYIVLLLIIIIWYATFSLSGLGSTYGQKMDSFLFYRVLKGVSVSVGVLALALFVFKIKDFSRLLIVIFYIFDLAILTGSRRLMYRILYSQKQKAYFVRHFLIVGSRQTAKEIIHTITRNREGTIKIVGCLETNAAEVGRVVMNDIKVIGTLDNLREIIENQVVDEILITMPLNEIDNSEWYLSFIDTYGIATRVMPDWYIRKFMANRPRFHTMEFEEILAEPALVLGRSLQKSEELLLKRVFDLTVALVALTIAAALFPLIALAIKGMSKGPVFYIQRRSGLYGRKFDVLKFRTMVANAEEMLEELRDFNEAGGAVFKMKNDPRIIPFVGHFLRKTSLDELPQLINVLRGEMSIVGPRPPIPDEVEKYELWQRRRLSMKPGLTCIWQVQTNRNDISFAQWMDMDLQYIDSWSLWLDFKIIGQTVPVVFLGQGR